MTICDPNGFTLVDHDPKTGRSVWSYFDGEKDVYRIDYPVDETIKENAEARASASSNWKGDYHRIASIPLNVVHGSGFAEAITQQDNKWLSRFLNDGDKRAWRTKEGKV
ncbi:hypothetical protein [uncultured Bradyrhizobium sp.]|uniref:hypothetical protein n=1 Tax=uncultured Bradyrhizobium sp. TaxID=199684 RepID=UPI0035CBD2CA